jgi:hypothetical protein
MHHTVYASFTNQYDGMKAVDSLLSRGFSWEDISLILPDEHHEKHAGAGDEPHVVSINMGFHPIHPHKAQAMNNEAPLPPEMPPLPPRSKSNHYDEKSIMAPGARGYTYDELGAVIPDTSGRRRRKSSRRKGDGYTVIDTEEGVGLGLGLGLLTALYIPGIGMFAGTAAIVASCMAGGAAVGGIGGGICGILTDRGTTDETARAMSDHVKAGRTTLSVSVPHSARESEVVRIITGFNGHVIAREHHR